jgi:ribosomal protein L34
MDAGEHREHGFRGRCDTRHSHRDLIDR